MKSILISIKPKWCELIANGKKTIEIRKTKPRIDTPFKCYIYCTKEKIIGDFILCKSKELSDLFGFNVTVGVNKGFAKEDDWKLKGKVIGEFICDNIKEFYPTMNLNELDISHVYIVDNSCVDMAELFKYANGKALYGWHISNLKIYNKPKELREFIPNCTGLQNGECTDFKNTSCPCQEKDYNIDGTVNVCTCTNRMNRPPQSWCYVEEVQE